MVQTLYKKIDEKFPVFREYRDRVAVMKKVT